jgi:hypothetical protein
MVQHKSCGKQIPRAVEQLQAKIYLRFSKVPAPTDARWNIVLAYSG